MGFSGSGQRWAARGPSQLEGTCRTKFLIRSARLATPFAVPDNKPLTPADPQDVQQTLAFALRFDGRKRVHNADEALARITAERLVEHLRQSGFVVMKRPPRSAPGLPDAAYRQRSSEPDPEQ